MKRRKKHTAMSLFAFQDVMASVIGILFFIVLIMALDIVNQQAPAASNESIPGNEYEQLKEEAKELKDRLQQLQDAIADTVQSTNLVDLGDENILKKVNQKNETLTGLYKMISEYQKELSELEGQSRNVHEELQLKLVDKLKLEQKMADMKERMRLAESQPPIAFIIDRADPLKPWLLELTQEAVRIAASDGRSVVVELTAPDFSTRKEQVFDWIKSQKPSTHYFVILYKPSGLQYRGDIEIGIKELGFDIGSDLIPEDDILF